MSEKPDYSDDITAEQWADIKAATEDYQSPDGDVISGEPWPTSKEAPP